MFPPYSSFSARSLVVGGGERKFGWFSARESTLVVQKMERGESVD